ncbi:MAG: NAD-dependent deacylase [Bacteroidota bacterium]
MSRTLCEELRRVLRSARSVAAFTGAGVSAESGVPTFRGEEGLWKKFRPEELAHPDAFLSNPALVWEWYRARKEIIASVRPNPAHTALAAMQEVFPLVAVITQNVDNLHRRAGSRTVFELHGNIERSYCTRCGTVSAEAEPAFAGDLPRCAAPGCGGLLRPDVVWFGEMLPQEEWNGAVRSMESADLVLSVGTSAAVYPAASLPLLGKRAGAFLAEVNPEPTPLTPHADAFLEGKAGEILPLLLDQARRLRNPAPDAP